MSENYEPFSNKNKKVIGKFELDTPEYIWIDEFFSPRSKMYSFNSGNDSKNNLKGISLSQPKYIKFEEYKKCLDGNDYKKECDNCNIRSLNHELYFQRVLKSTLSPFDDKRC